MTELKLHYLLSKLFKLIPTLRIMMHQSSGSNSEARPTTLSQSLSTYPHSAFLLIWNGLSALTLFHSALLFFPLPSPLFFESHKNYQSRPSWKHFRATQWMLKNFLSALMKERDGKNDKNYLEPDADDFFFVWIISTLAFKVKIAFGFDNGAASLSRCCGLTRAATIPLFINFWKIGHRLCSDERPFGNWAGCWHGFESWCWLVEWSPPLTVVLKANNHFLSQGYKFVQFKPTEENHVYRWLDVDCWLSTRA